MKYFAKIRKKSVVFKYFAFTYEQVAGKNLKKCYKGRVAHPVFAEVFCARCV